MCGRYNFTAEEAAEIKEIVAEIERRLYAVKGEASPGIKMGEIYPTNFVPVLVPGDGRPAPVPMTWGFPNFATKSKSAVVINARSETVLEKRMFAQSVLNRRCVVPSTGFYEWDRADGQKIKYLFRRPGEAALYMAGIWNIYKDQDGGEKQRFVILTTEANRSMKADIQELTLFPDGEERLIHNRMPVILSRSEQEEWLSGPVDFERLFQREHVLLEKLAV